MISENVQHLGHEVRATRERIIDALLRRLDLQPRRSALAPLMWFAAGAITGGAAIFFLAPTAGLKVRDRIIKLAKERIPMRGNGAQPSQPVTH